LQASVAAGGKALVGELTSWSILSVCYGSVFDAAGAGSQSEKKVADFCPIQQHHETSTYLPQLYPFFF
jgi:hypothetical protein